MLKTIKNILTVLLGTFIVSVSINLFLAPAGIAPGGISGLSIVINHLWNLPIGLSILVLNIPIFIAGLFYFNKRFIISSLFGMVTLSIFTDFFNFIPKITQDTLLSAIYGGVLLGLGIGLVFSAGYTTGGTDIAAQILKKKFPKISVGRFILIIDTFIVILAGIAYHEWETVLYSAIGLYISSFLIDIIIEGGDKAKVAYIISEKPEEISALINSQLDRGTTLLHGSSLFTRTDKAVLMCVIKKYQLRGLKMVISQVDPTAFVVFTDAREVLGKGFE